MQLLRLITYSSKNPYFNLAFEEAIVRLRLDNEVPDTLRIWKNPPSVIIGYHQNPNLEVNLNFCKAHHIPVVRRISGGGAVYHDYGNLNYSFIIDTHDWNIADKPSSEVYKFLCDGVISGLRKLGLNASFKPFNDIVVNEKKVSGNAQFKLYNILLHHGTILIDLDIDMMSKALNISYEKLADKGISSIKSRVTTITRELKKRIDINLVIKKLLEGISETYDVKIKQDNPTKKELVLAKKLYEEKYSKDSWNLQNVELVENIFSFKLPIGLIRIGITVEMKTIKKFRLWGDFPTAYADLVDALQKEFEGLSLDDLNEKNIEYICKKLMFNKILSRDFCTKLKIFLHKLSER